MLLPTGALTVLLAWSAATVTTCAATKGSVSAAAISELQSVQDEIHELLEGDAHSLSVMRGMLDARADELEGTIVHLQEYEQDLIQRTVSLKQRIQQVHAVQIKLLAKQLNETIPTELKTRQSVESQSPSDSQVQSPKVATISVSDVKEILKGDDILDDTEATLKQWIVRVVEQEVTNARVAAAVKKRKTKNLNKTKPSLKSTICVTPSEGALLLQESLVQHRSPGPPDHLATATVIHELTSPTYTAPPSTENVMANVWWRKYIPEDWEQHLLPQGWQEWNVGLPDSFARLLVSGVSLSFASNYRGGSMGFVALFLYVPIRSYCISSGL
jgi:hypothetical protein